MTEKVKVNGNKIEINNTVISGLNNDFLEYIKDLQKKAEQGEHYKHLYSEVKKQKDDVVEYIKSYNLPEDLGHFGEAPISIRELREILRMLGEIDE